jgi:peptide/nickel transport system substrate-binding protein
MTRLDPHELDDPIAALFGAAICDPLYALDALGRPYPALARGFPEPMPAGARVRLRSGLVTGRGKPISAADAAGSLVRAMRRGAAPLFSGLRAPRVSPKDPLLLEFPGADATTLAERLWSPLAAILPSRYSPFAPDGTGAFTARLERGVLTLLRNPHAARGAAYLDSIEVRTVSELSDALRAFEAGTADVGWLGSGFYKARPGALAFRGSAYGWALLRTGKKAGRWSAPGVAQTLIDGIEPRRLEHLGLQGLPTKTGNQVAWGGGPAEILVADDAPQLALVAGFLSTVLSGPGHELRISSRPRTEIAERRVTRDYALLVDFVRNMGPKGPMTQRALLAAENPDLALKPPHIETYDARSIARGLSLGVIGELWSQGAHAPGIRALSGWQLGDVFRLPPNVT